MSWWPCIQTRIWGLADRPTTHGVIAATPVPEAGNTVEAYNVTLVATACSGLAVKHLYGGRIMLRLHIEGPRAIFLEPNGKELTVYGSVVSAASRDGNNILDLVPEPQRVLAPRSVVFAGTQEECSFVYRMELPQAWINCACTLCRKWGWLSPLVVTAGGNNWRYKMALGQIKLEGYGERVVS